MSGFVDLPDLCRSLQILAWPAHGEPLALLPLETSTDAHFPARTLGFPGWRWLATDHLDVIARSEHASEATLAFLAHLRSSTDWDMLDLDGLRAESWIARHAAGAFSLPRFVHRPLEATEVKHLDLVRGDGGRLFSPNTTRRTRQDLESATSAGGGFEILSTPNDIVRGLPEMMDLHQARFGSSSQIFSTALRRTFHLTVAARMGQAGTLRLYRLRVGDITAAASYVPVWDGTLYFYGEGLQPHAAKRSPGLSVKVLAMLDAQREGLRRADFCRGDHEWKRRLTQEAQFDVRVRVVRCSLRSAAVAGRAGARRLRRPHGFSGPARRNPATDNP